jgi:hypothetical protein
MKRAKLTVKTATATVHFYDDVCLTRAWGGKLTVSRHIPHWYLPCEQMAFFESYEFYAYDVPIDEPSRHGCNQGA